jgi:hypothetical protein
VRAKTVVLDLERVLEEAIVRARTRRVHGTGFIVAAEWVCADGFLYLQSAAKKATAMARVWRVILTFFQKTNSAGQMLVVL